MENTFRKIDRIKEEILESDEVKYFPEIKKSNKWENHFACVAGHWKNWCDPC